MGKVSTSLRGRPSKRKGKGEQRENEKDVHGRRGGRYCFLSSKHKICDWLELNLCQSPI